MVSFSHFISTIYVCCLCLDFIAPLMLRLCCRILGQSVTSNLMILKLCKMFSVPLKERQQGDISNYYIITISHNGHTECIRFCEPLFFSKLFDCICVCLQQIVSISWIEGNKHVHEHNSLCFMLSSDWTNNPSCSIPYIIIHFSGSHSGVQEPQGSVKYSQKVCDFLHFVTGNRNPPLSKVIIIIV